MNCRETRYLLSLYLDGELTPADASEVRAHLSECPSCRRIEAEYRRDQGLIGQHLRTVRYLPVSGRVRAELRGRGRARDGWSALLSGGQRLVGAAAVVALLTLVLVSGLVLRDLSGSRAKPPATESASAVALGTGATPLSAVPDATPMLASASPEPLNALSDVVFAALQQHDLVFDVASRDGSTIDLGAGEVHLLKLAVDRGVTYLEYTSSVPGGVADKITLLDYHEIEQHPYFLGAVSQVATLAPRGESTTQWMAFPGVDPSTKTTDLMIRVRASDGPHDVRVPVDLSPIRDLLRTSSDPRSLPGKVADKGVSIAGLTLTRGVVVSTLQMTAATDATASISPVSGADAALAPAVLAGGKPVAVAGFGTVRTDNTVTITLNLYQLPDSGTLTTTIEVLPIGGGKATRGPWTLTSTLDQTAPRPTPTPMTTARATATTTPPAVKTPVSAVTPTPTPTRQPAGPLPGDLYFLASTDDGILALWKQPAEGTNPYVVVKPKSDIGAYWLIPGIGQVAYKLDIDDHVYLANATDGTPLGQAAGPDGNPLSEYVPSPDGRRIALISGDRTTLWIGDASGKNAQKLFAVQEPAADTIHNLAWSADGTTLLFLKSRIATGTVPVVMRATPGASIWTGSSQAMDVAIAPDGSAVVYSTYAGIFRVDLASGKESDITPSALRGTGSRLFNDIVWLPDGTVTFTYRQNATAYVPAALWQMRGDGSAAQKVRDDLGEVLDIAWTPSEGSYGFVVGTAESQPGDGKASAGLVFYSWNKADPRPLATNMSSRQFRSLQWAVKGR